MIQLIRTQPLFFLSTKLLFACFVFFYLLEIPYGNCQETSGTWKWSLNGSEVSFSEIASTVYCLDAKDTLELEYLPSTKVDSLSYLWTGIEFWIQAYISKPIFMGKYQTEKAEPVPKAIFCLADLIDQTSLPPGESALSGALLIKPLLLISGSTVLQTIDIPPEIQDVTITLVRECGG